MLVSANQLPGLQIRAETAEGRQLLNLIRDRLGEDQKHTASDDAIAHGFLHLLTRDREHADAARQVIEQWIKHPDAGAQTGEKAAIAVLAWDLIHDACGLAFNKRMVQAIEANYQRVADIEGVRPNRSMASNFNARWRPALGLMALAVLNEPAADQEKAREMLAFAKEHAAGYLTPALGNGGWNTEHGRHSARPHVPLSLCGA